MTQKNETPILIISLLITAGLLGGGYWWFTQRSSIDVGKVTQQAPSNNSGLSQSSPSGSSGDTNFTQVQNVPSGLFSYGGSTSWAPIRATVDSAIQSTRPEFRLRYTDPTGHSPSSGQGIKMLLDGQIAFAQSSRPVSDQEYQQAQQRGFTLRQVPVAIDGIAIAANPSLNVPGLTVDQVRGIFLGQIKNWQEVGGPNLAIVPLSRTPNLGGIFFETVLGGQPLGSNVQIVSTTTQALQKLGATPGGVYFASASEVVPQCTIKPLAIARSANQWVPPYRGTFLEKCPGGQRNQLNLKAFQEGSYPITRNLFVVVKQNGQAEQQAGEAYVRLLVTDQGQELLEKAGFVRVR
ncbi:MAG: solute-binding protein [Leptolyngbyaceae cyanobacterium SU_3_3]|nr:solute-binding protein [Leptolyngbyaceae cyanobacterium SU_3_3]NJR48988.1 solute-binding protein [Leptolyngbyaceae cyanobacterium CSU_1_3]